MFVKMFWYLVAALLTLHVRAAVRPNLWASSNQISKFMFISHWSWHGIDMRIFSVAMKAITSSLSIFQFGHTIYRDSCAHWQFVKIDNPLSLSLCNKYLYLSIAIAFNWWWKYGLQAYCISIGCCFKYNDHKRREKKTQITADFHYFIFWLNVALGEQCVSFFFLFISLLLTIGHLRSAYASSKKHICFFFCSCCCYCCGDRINAPQSI